ncbi:MAG: tetratricopeptide repeat protein [Candidatus Electronema sp. V4]|uniref:tetratricopeptide repeat protein n=1 Tax=Candidatus Electronema sp. V4 TaxID=3454756 RepID=UPI0040555CCD
MNTPLHITNLGNDSLKKTFFAYPGQTGRVLRPISNLSFALNWFFGQDKIFGYHVVNFTIHFFAAIFLYQCCLLILSTPRLDRKYKKGKFFIAALATVLWAVNPVQTQAITYIVQRMASLSALFSIIAIWFYLKARLMFGKRRIFFYLGTFTAFFLAVGSKENAVLLPVSILLIEFFFFKQNIRVDKQTVLFSLAALGLVFTFTLMLGGLDFFINIFQPLPERSFTVWQRLLTQPRIIVFYITLLLYPSPLRLSIEHDVQISTSLFSPNSTIPAFLLLFIIFIYSIFFQKKQPVFSFAIIFFLLNHFVESTFLNLEIVFEHRNYLPSFFFFLPVAAIIYSVLEIYRKKRVMVIIISVGTIGLIVLFSIGTILRNSVWQTDTSLWTDALKKAPKNSRPYINLGYNLQYEGNYEAAFNLYHSSLGKYSSTPWKDQVVANNGMGHLMMKIGRYEQAFSFFEQAAVLSRNRSISIYTEAFFQKSKSLVLTGKYRQVLTDMSFFINNNEKDSKVRQLYAELLIFTNKYKEAIVALQKVLAFSDHKSMEYRMALVDLALVYAKSGSHDKSDLYLRFARAADSPKIPILLGLLEHSMRADNQAQAKQAFNQLLEEFTWAGLMATLEQPNLDYPALPVSYFLIRQYAVQWLADHQQIP